MKTQNKALSTKRIIVDAVMALMILLFVYAAVSKLLDYEKFRVELAKSPMLTMFASEIAWILPVLELLLAVMMIFPKFQLPGLYISFGLMVMFTAYIIAILQFSEYIPCSCGGILQEMTWTTHLIFNSIVIFLALAAVMLYRKEHAA